MPLIPAVVRSTPPLLIGPSISMAPFDWRSCAFVADVLDCFRKFEKIHFYKSVSKNKNLNQIFSKEALPMLFLKEDYPVTHALLDKFNITARNANGRRTIPNLTQLFDIILAKNKETFEFLVSFSKIYIFTIVDVGFADDTAGVAEVLSSPSREGMFEHIFQHGIPLSRGKTRFRC